MALNAYANCHYAECYDIQHDKVQHNTQHNNKNATLEADVFCSNESIMLSIIILSVEFL